MKTLSRFAAGQHDSDRASVSLAQHYKQTDLVSNTSGVGARG